jgi:hypothetical protein
MATLTPQTKRRTKQTIRFWTLLRSSIREHGPLTVRGVYYRMLSIPGHANVYGVRKGDSGYNKVKNAVRDMREAGFLDADLIIDTSRRSIESKKYEDEYDYFQSFARLYRSDWWYDHEDYIEIWTEKEAVVPMTQGVTKGRQVTLRPFKGYPSFTYLSDIAKRISERTAAGKRVTVYYFGDCDPAGQDIVRDIERRLRTFWKISFKLVHAGISDQHVQNYGLLTHDIDPKHMEGPKWDAYLGVNGDKTQAVEIDALIPKDLRAIITSMIDQHMPSSVAVTRQKRDDKVRELLIDRAMLHSVGLETACAGLGI